LGASIIFLLLVGLYASLTGANVAGLSSSAVWLLIIAAVVGGYMAMNIGANDVANNMGPAVGSGAMTMGWAILVAAVFEVMGAIIAGGDVVGTIKGGIIDIKQVPDVAQFAWLMFAALLAGAMWLHLATAIGAPVSTTHSIIGAVMGAGIAAGGWGLVNWGTVGNIALSWVISPLAGGLVAAAFLYFIKRSITYRTDMTEAATGGALADRGHGLGVWHLHVAQGSGPTGEGRVLAGCARGRCVRSGRLGPGEETDRHPGKAPGKQQGRCQPPVHLATGVFSRLAELCPWRQ